jgi:hypothetical protein
MGFDRYPHTHHRKPGWSAKIFATIILLTKGSWAHTPHVAEKVSSTAIGKLIENCVPSKF